MAIASWLECTHWFRHSLIMPILSFDIEEITEWLLGYLVAAKILLIKWFDSSRKLCTLIVREALESLRMHKGTFRIYFNTWEGTTASKPPAHICDLRHNGVQADRQPQKLRRYSANCTWIIFFQRHFISLTWFIQDGGHGKGGGVALFIPASFSEMLVHT